MTKRLMIILFFLFSVYIGSSQEIFGVVLDKKTSKPLPGASVYFDNTTIGTTTNDSGEFSLEINKEIETPLIISFIGYETLVLYNYSTVKKLKIVLNESADILNEVVLTGKEDWPLELKLAEFKKNYLGKSKNGLASELLNEENLVLKYDKKNKKLTAYTKEPIQIKNTNLGYLITTDLKHFEVNYAYVSKNRKRLKVNYVFYSGRNFYKSLVSSSNLNTRYKRLDSYYGSPLHFMRAIANKSLEDEKYILYINGIPYASKKIITVVPMVDNGKVMVKFRERFSVVYNKENRSYVESTASKFYIDKFGNHSPPKAVRFGGDFGRQRMGDALPLDFLLDKK